MTLTDIASSRGVGVASLRRKLNRAGIVPPKTNDEALEQSVIDLLTTDKRLRGKASGAVATLKRAASTPLKVPQIQANPQTSPQNGAQDGHRDAEEKKGRQNGLKSPVPKVGSSWSRFADIFPILPLPSLGLAASWGVYHFSLHFVPMAVAIIEAAGFEAVYIGLAISNGLSADLRKRVTQVSLSAVAVSVTYNAISAALYASTGGDMEKSHDLISALHPVLFWVVAILHGAPLAILAYFVSNLVIHQKRKPL